MVVLTFASACSEVGPSGSTLSETSLVVDESGERGSASTTSPTLLPSMPARSTQRIALHNDRAGVEDDCPDTESDWWHFVIAPNGDTHSFRKITLRLAGESVQFEQIDMWDNNGQWDNVFIMVPSDYELESLGKSGSMAEISPESGPVRFVLSHLCRGTGSEREDATTTTIGFLQPEEQVSSTTLVDGSSVEVSTSAPNIVSDDDFVSEDSGSSTVTDGSDPAPGSGDDAEGLVNDGAPHSGSSLDGPVTGINVNRWSTTSAVLLFTGLLLLLCLEIRYRVRCPRKESP